MGDRFDEVARAMATGMPRRRVLRLLAGSLAAAVGTTVAGLSASAHDRRHTEYWKKPHGHKDHIRVNQTMPRPPVVNQTMPRPPAVNQTMPQPPAINQTFPQWFGGW